MFKIVRWILISVPIILVHAARDTGSFADVVLNDIRCENYAKHIVTLFEVYFVRFNGRRAISGAFRYNQLIPDMQLQFTLTFEKPDKTRLQMLDLVINACNFFNGAFNNLKIPRLILKELKRQKTLPKQCPFEANKTFRFDNYEFKVPKFPLPNLKFIYNLTLHNGHSRQKIIHISLKGATKRFSS